MMCQRKNKNFSRPINPKPYSHSFSQKHRQTKLLSGSRLLIEGTIYSISDILLETDDKFWEF